MALTPAARLAQVAQALERLGTGPDEEHAALWETLSLAALRLARLHATRDPSWTREVTTYMTLHALTQNLEEFAPLARLGRQSVTPTEDSDFPAT